MDSRNQGAPRSADTSSHRILKYCSSFTRWILLDGNRFLVTLGIVITTFLVFFWLGYRDIVEIGRSSTPLLYLFGALVGGNITLITIVVTISQLILARELRSPRELQMELKSAEEYRESVEEETGRSGVPEQPAEFLHVLVEDTHHQVMTLIRVESELSDSVLKDELEELTASLRINLEETLEKLESSQGGVFSALSTVLDADFAARLNHSRWIRQAYEDNLSESQQTLLYDLEQRIKQIDIARQYFKTIYIKQELGGASMLIMYTGLGAVVLGLIFLLFTGYAQTPLSSLALTILIPLAIAVNLLPLALLIAHVMRITTVARRTAAITPFISPGE